MEKKNSLATKLHREFLPPECRAEYDVIVEALGEMPTSMYRIFVMWYIDRMTIGEIAFARQDTKAHIASVLISGQERIKAKLRGAMRGRKVNWTRVNVKNKTPIVIGALEGFVERVFDEPALSNIVSVSIEKAKSGVTVETADTARKTSTKRSQQTKPIAVYRAQMRSPIKRRFSFGGLKGGFAPVAAMAVAGVFIMRESLIFKVVAFATAGAVAAGGGMLLYQTVNNIHDGGQATQIAASQFAGGGSSYDVQPGVSTRDISNGKPYEVSGPAPSEGPADTGFSGPVAGVNDRIPTSALSEGEVSAAQTPQAYFDAVANGRIVMSSNVSAAGHVNPLSARLVGADPAQGEITWRITTTDETATVISQGAGVEVTGPLAKLQEIKGNNAYYIEFTYTVSDGTSVTFARPVIIDTGTISVNEYE